MVAFRVLSTPSSIRVFGRDKTGNQQGDSQDWNELVNLHKSPLSVGKEVLLSKREIGLKSFTTNKQQTPEGFPKKFYPLSFFLLRDPTYHSQTVTRMQPPIRKKRK